MLVAGAGAAPTSTCCPGKTVGGTRFDLVQEEDTTQFGCTENCVYQKVKHKIKQNKYGTVKKLCCAALLAISKTLILILFLYLV